MSATREATLDVVSRDTIPVALIDPDPDQPRRTFDQAALDELVASILANGLVSPILLRPNGDRFLIVAGERRWRAMCQLGWTDIPAEVRDLDDDDARWLQLVENLNRHDLSPVEEARAYKAMLDRGETQQVVAQRAGKTRSYVAQKLRLLDLPAPLSLLLDRRELTEGHVRQLLRFKAFYREGHKLAIEQGPKDFTEETVRAMWDDCQSPESRCALVFVTVRSARPLDWPPGYPFDGKDRPLVVEATHAQWVEVAKRRELIFWEQVAFWYAAMAVTYDLSVADLSTVVNRWVEHIQAAVIYVNCLGPAEPPKDDPGRSAEWFAYRSDLRHAGLTDDHKHLMEAALKQLESGSLLMPSIAQDGSPSQEWYLKTTWREEL